MGEIHTPKRAPKPPMKTALRSNGTVYAIIVKPPERAPPTPSPAMALPMMKTILLGATAEMSDPMKNITMTKMYVAFTLNI